MMVLDDHGGAKPVVAYRLVEAATRRLAAACPSLTLAPPPQGDLRVEGSELEVVAPGILEDFPWSGTACLTCCIHLMNSTVCA